MPEVPSQSAIILYDGVCGLCNRFNRFILSRDRHDRFRLASLQSNFARDLLQRHGLSPGNLDTVYLVLDAGTPQERFFGRSEAVVNIMRRLGPFWRVLGGAFALLPRLVRDWLYNLVARSRYRIFGRYDVCPLPSEKDGRKFIEV
ncbi:MAG TPA: DCC1-like thiol-disulfide oxidoreductase family protein [Terriglobales bacterium]|nr:DCC1-like thiol-disulfide oxidoreductase family protein [Terriglobales bacterium]